jgi:16S rRNA processing protein RimM
VAAVHNFGAGDIIEIKLAHGNETELLPFDATTVPEVDIANGCLVVELPRSDNEMPPPLRGRPTAKRSGGG